MTIRIFVTFAGFMLLIGGIFCPLISPLGIIKWNLFDLNRIFATVLLLIAISGVAATIMKNVPLIKLVGWNTLALVVLVFIAVVMKVNTAFNLIPFPKISNTLSGLIHYRWGWYLLFAGPIVVLLGAGNRRSIATPAK